MAPRSGSGSGSPALVTTDNGANTLKSVKLPSNEQLKENAFADEDSPGTSQAASSNSNVENDVYSNEDSECEATDSSAFNIEILLESLAAFDFVESTSHPILQGLRCAAHTLQLAVDDALKQSSLKSDIAKARHVCKILRNPFIRSSHKFCPILIHYVLNKIS